MKPRLLVAAAVLAAGASAGAAGPDCAQATQDLDRAQQALSSATRAADTTAAAYARCMEKAGACGAQKTAYDAALAARAKAVADHKAKSARKQAACP